MVKILKLCTIVRSKIRPDCAKFNWLVYKNYWFPNIFFVNPGIVTIPGFCSPAHDAAHDAAHKTSLYCSRSHT